MDLRDPATRARHEVPNGWGEAEKARQIAVEKINGWLRELKARGVNFALPEFDTTLEARSILTGKGQTPVEWQATKSGEYGGEQGEWVAKIDFDDPPKDQNAASLKVPHVGYGVAFVASGRGKPAIARVGHIVVSEKVLEACRPHPRHRFWFESRTRRT
jgi:hypothetical protein